MSNKVTRGTTKQQREREKVSAAMAEEMAHMLDAEDGTPAWAKLLLRESKQT